ncbi:MAG: recombinase RecT, partial [Alphaproteobacteria bacterium]
AILWAKAVLVYEGDEFRYRGPAEAPVHEADVFDESRIDPKEPLKGMRGGYCIAKLPSGEVLVETMTAGEILEVRDSSKARKGPWSGPWAGEMAKKTLIKRASKTWPQTGDRQRFDVAVDVLNQHEGLLEDEPIEEAKLDEFLSLVANSDSWGVVAWLAENSERTAAAAFNSAPAGQKTKFKDRVRDLQREAESVVADYIEQIGNALDASDSYALQLIEELEPHEWRIVEARLTEVQHRQIELIKEQAA